LTGNDFGHAGRAQLHLHELQLTYFAKSLLFALILEPWILHREGAEE
jgi:hypothetical protein